MMGWAKDFVASRLLSPCGCLVVFFSETERLKPRAGLRFLLLPQLYVYWCYKPKSDCGLFLQNISTVTTCTWLNALSHHKPGLNTK